MRKLTFAQATLEAMAEEMKKDDKVYVIGEDIARQGGVFGQFKGLSQEFPGRVIDSPISETFIIGGGVGAALGVSNFSENPDMAVEFVKFLLSRDEMVSMYTKNTAIPIRTDITAADIGRTDDPYFAQAVEMAGGLYFWPDNCLSADVVNIYCSLPCQVLVGNMSLDELTRAMDDAQLD